jgi:hypothetical protein
MSATLAGLCSVGSVLTTRVVYGKRDWVNHPKTACTPYTPNTRRFPGTRPVHARGLSTAVGGRTRAPKNRSCFADYLRAPDGDYSSQRSGNRKPQRLRAPDFAAALAYQYAPARRRSTRKEHCYGR